MKNLLVVHQGIGFGGMEVRLLDWLRRIDYSRYAVSVASPSKGFLQQLANSGLGAKRIELAAQQQVALFGCYDPKIGVDRLANRSFGRVFRPWLRFLLRHRPDHVVMMEGNFKMLPFASVLAAFLVSRGNVYMTEHSPYMLEEPPQRISRKHFGFIPGLGFWWYKQVWLKIWPWRMRSRLCRRVLAASETIKERAIGFYGYPADKMGVINHGIDTERFRPSPTAKMEWRRAHNIPPEDLVIVSTARFDPEKRVERLVQAFESVLPKHRNVWLLLAGEGQLKQELEKRILDSPAKHRIKLLGQVQDVAPVLQAGDIYVLPSDFEGCPIALMEAMAMMLVCVVSRIPGMEQTIENDNNGFLVDFSPEGVRSGIEKALELGPLGRQQLGERARQTAFQKYDVRKAVENALLQLNIAFVREQSS